MAHHLRYSNDVVIAAANETEQCLPRILPKYSHSSELRRLALEVLVCQGPSRVQGGEIGVEIQVMPDEVWSVILVVARD